MSEQGEDQKARTRATFNLIAPVYGSAGPGCFAYFGSRLVERARIEPGQRVLDVACGRGAVLFPAVERAGVAGTVTAIDLAEAMVEATQSEAKRRGVSADILVMDAERPAFPDASFDRVLCGFGLMFFPRLDQALAEFRRVLVPGGWLGVSTWQVPDAADLAAVLDAEVPDVAPPNRLTEPDQLAQRLAESGFVDVDVQRDSQAFRYDSLDEYWRNARGTGLRRRLDRLDAEQTMRVRAALAERVRPFTRDDGIYLSATALLAVARR